MPKKRSTEPHSARCTISGWWRAPSSPTYSRPKRRRQIEIELHGGELPGPADGVDQLHVDFRAVERRFARHALVRNVHAVKRVLSARPRRVSSPPACRHNFPDASRSPSGKLHLIVVEAENPHHREREIDAGLQFRASICSGMQKMCASSCVKPRTRSKPCSTPERS